MSVSETGNPAHRGLAALVARPWFWIGFVVLAMAWPIARTLSLRLPPPLPVLAEVPAFSLTDQHGQPFGADELRGRVWVASFFFTRCTTVCPLFTAKMAKVQHRARNLGQAFHLVSFSVDPEYDTPARLEAYAKQHRASPRMWSFLTGSPEAVQAAVVQGLKVSASRQGPDPAALFHGSHFVLVDREMHIRGYYDSADPDAVDRLMRDVGLLVNRGG